MREREREREEREREREREMFPVYRWLLHDPDMVLRSNYRPYLEAVDRFYTELFKILTPLQV